MQSYNETKSQDYMKMMNGNSTHSSSSSSNSSSPSLSLPSSSEAHSLPDDADTDNGTAGIATPFGSDVGSLLFRTATPIICAFGIVGIILTVIVLSRKTMRTSTNCYLTALSLADLFYLVLLASMLTNLQAPFTSDAARSVFMMYTTYAVIAMQVLLMSSVWLTVVLAIERYVAICRPFLAVWLCTVRKARAIIGVVFLLATACRLPNFWEKRVAVYIDPATNSSIYYHEDTDLCDNHLYTTVYPVLVDALLVSVVPFILLVFLNVRLIVQVRSSTKYLQRNTRGSTGCIMAQKEEQQVTVMLISVVIVFFICTAPYLTYTAIYSVNSFDTSLPGIHLLRYVTILLLTLKSAVNFIVYCFCSRRFRKILMALLRGRSADAAESGPETTGQTAVEARGGRGALMCRKTDHDVGRSRATKKSLLKRMTERNNSVKTKNFALTDIKELQESKPIV